MKPLRHHPRGKRPGSLPSVLVFLVLAIVSVARGSAAETTRDYLGPCALAVSPAAERLYVACADARQVVWVELPGGKISRRADMPAKPTDLLLTPDGKRLAVTCADAESCLVVLDTQTGRRLATIPLGHTARGASCGANDMLYVCNRFDNNLSVVDLAAGEELARVPVEREPIAAAVTPDGTSVYVANHLPNMRADVAFPDPVAAAITVIDTCTLETRSIELPSGSSSLRSLCISPDGTVVLVTHILSNFQEVPFRVNMGWINMNVVSIIDTRKQSVISTIGLDELDFGAGNPWDVAYSGDGKSVCVTRDGAHELSVIRHADLVSEEARRTMSPMPGAWPVYPSLGISLWRRIKLPGKGPRGLAMGESEAHVAEYFSDTIASIKLDDQDDSVRSIALGPTPELSPQRRGQLLFHDATICFQQWQSCASCHPDERSDGLNWDLLNDGVGNPKNTKSMLLSYKTPPSMATGVRKSAEVAVRSGLTHILFAERSEEDALAIDAYLRTLEPVPSPYLVDGQLSPAAKRGKQLFQQAKCFRCHPAPLYTDLRTHRIGSRSSRQRIEDLDTPTLVEVWRTAPYLHDGRHLTIRELLAEGRHGLVESRNGSWTEQDFHDLAEFVLSL